MSLNYSITRKLMRHAKFYNEQVLPFFRSTPRFAVQAYCLRDNKELIDAITKNNNKSDDSNDSSSVGPSPDDYLSLQDIIRKASKSTTSSPSTTTSTSSTVFAMNSLRLLSTWNQRMLNTSHGTFNLAAGSGGDKNKTSTSTATSNNKSYKFEVGDIVQHSELNHVGVVAAKMPICFETEDWINENLGSVNDYRLSQPWYLILVARHDPLPFDFVRYGSQLTHVAGPKEPIGCHRMLPMFFSGFCKKTGRYLARENNVASIVSETLKVRSEEKTKRIAMTKKQQHQILKQVVAATGGGKKQKIVIPAFADENNTSSSTISVQQQQQNNNNSIIRKKKTSTELAKSPQSSVARRSKSHFAAVSASVARQQQQQNSSTRKSSSNSNSSSSSSNVRTTSSSSSSATASKTGKL